MSTLVVVESPTKARTIARYLGDGYVVESSIGHIRDLPRRASDVPKSLKGEPWSRLGVDTENDFKTLYVIPADKRKQVSRLKSLLSDAEQLYLATDEDREGESIAWHLVQVLNPRVEVRRMVFHEITPTAIAHALDNTRDIDRRLVDAQEARRVLDRLFGYEVSPVLWKKVQPRLSAGRVQSPATRIIVERERERMAFRAAAYWDLEAVFDTSDGGELFTATLVEVAGKRVAAGRDFDASGRMQGDGVMLLDEESADDLAQGLADAEFSVRSVEHKPWSRKPNPPFRTSTLQQEAGRKLRFSSARTMSVAQRLYEGGYITYMRTDSITLSDAAISAARRQATELYGADTVPARPRVWSKKVKNAQEAHEAIRPAGDRFRTPEEVRIELDGDQFKLYQLIWRRTVASEMKDATGQRVQIRVSGDSADGRSTLFAASGRAVTFPGFLLAYGDETADDEERHLPTVGERDRLVLVGLEPKGHETKPPARYTEATLVRRLEELGIGRPSTYASIISTIQDRGYVWKRGAALVPSFTAFATVTLLEEHFPNLVDYTFTARMEDDLDDIALGNREYIPWLANFYFGNGHPGLKSMVESRLEEIDARAVNSIPLGEDPDGNEIVVRVGRYGPYVQRGEDTASIPEDLPPDELTVAHAAELLSAPTGERVLGEDPETGLPVIARNGRFGPYVQLGQLDPDAKEKPKTASLFKTMVLERLTLEQALRLLSQPRLVGTDPESGAEIFAQNGRYGPYLRMGKETRSLDNEDQIFEVTVSEAIELFAQPKRGRRRAVALAELGPDPASGKPIEVRSGRYGPYVTDGEFNASLRTGDTVENITIERAAELLAERRAKGPAKKGGGGTSASSTSAGKSAAKKSNKKASSKRASSKRASPKKASSRAAAKKSPAEKPVSEKGAATAGADDDGSGNAP